MTNLTVCVLSFNRASYLKEALQSILDQTQKPANIIVFDNGSKDDVRDAVEMYLENGVSWVGADFNHSHIWNFKRAIANVSSDYVMVLHDDDRLCPDFIEKQLAFLKLNPDLGAVTCNGYLIDESGKRTGGLLRAGFIDTEPDFFRCSADVAMSYASDICLPYSPIIYKTNSIKRIALQEDFGKVCDAVLLCDLADRDAIAYRAVALYECRVHVGQDSGYFPVELMNKLEEFFWTRKSQKPEDVRHLHKLLIRQHTSRVIRRIFYAGKDLKSLSVLYSALASISEEKFSAFEALGILWRVSIKLSNKLYKNL